MELAAHLGMTVGEMRARMTVRELALWRMKWNEEPWGEHRADLRNAQLCAIMVNMNRDTKKHPDPIPIDKFMLFQRKQEEPERKPRTTIAPETVSWLYAMAAKNDAEKKGKRGN